MLAGRLEKEPIVKGFNIEQDNLRVLYHTGITEKYCYAKRLGYSAKVFSFRIDEEGAYFRERLPIYNGYETDPLGDGDDTKLSQHVLLQRKDLNEATFIEKRVAMQELLQVFLEKSAAVHCFYPDEVLRKDWQHVMDSDPDRYVRNNAFDFFVNLGNAKRPGHSLLEHFFEYTSETSSSMILHCMNEVLLSRKEMTTSEIRKHLRWNIGDKILSPIAYAAIFARFRITGPVIDIHPEKGHKALACAKMGIPYAIYNPGNEDALCNLTGLELLDADSLASAQLVISDHNFGSFGLDTKYADKAKYLLAYVPVENKEATVAAHNPTTFSKVVVSKLDSIRGDSDYLLFW